MGAFRSQRGLISEINVTPFVDVALVLLVIFMVTAPAILKDVIGIKLPQAESGTQNQKLSLAVAINRNGNILLNGQLVSEDELRVEVKKALRTDPQTQAIVAADEMSTHKDVVRAIDIIRSAGLERFALQVKRRDT